MINMSTNCFIITIISVVVLFCYGGYFFTTSSLAASTACCFITEQRQSVTEETNRKQQRGTECVRLRVPPHPCCAVSYSGCPLGPWLTHTSTYRSCSAGFAPPPPSIHPTAQSSVWLFLSSPVSAALPQQDWTCTQLPKQSCVQGTVCHCVCCYSCGAELQHPAGHSKCLV